METTVIILNFFNTLPVKSKIGLVILFLTICFIGVTLLVEKAPSMKQDDEEEEK